MQRLAHLVPVLVALAVLSAAAAWSLGRAERRQELMAWLGGARRERARVRARTEAAGSVGADLRAQMALAGWEGMRLETWVSLRMAAAAAVGVVLAVGCSGLAARLPGGLPLRLLGIVLVGALGAVLGQGLPQLVWQMAVARRRRRTEAELLGFTDLLGVLVEGGLSFEAAARWVCREQGGLLSAEFARVLSAGEHQGVGTVAALGALAERLPHPEVRYLADAIGDGAEMGRGLGQTLRAAAGSLRAMRYEALQHRAQGQGISSSVLLALCAAVPTGLLILYPGLRLMLKGL